MSPIEHDPEYDDPETESTEPAEGSVVGARVQALRTAAGFTQKQVAQALGKPQSWVSNREKGKIRLSVEEAEAILRACGYGVGLVVLHGELNEFLSEVEQADPEHIEAALLLLRAFPRMERETRELISGMFRLALERSGQGGEAG